MILYAESSAVARWLLGQSHASEVEEHLRTAEAVVTSALTILECRRALLRIAQEGAAPEAAIADARSWLRRASDGWMLVALNDEVLERAAQPFPVEPIRSLDAVHLATLLTVRASVPGLTLLSLDDRLRRNGAALGIDCLPRP